MQTMRDMLRRELGRSLAALPELDRLAAAWSVACGSALAGRGDIVGYEQGTVRVRVSGAEWLDTFGQMRGILTSDLHRIARVPVTAIHFELPPSQARQENA